MVIRFAPSILTVWLISCPIVPAPKINTLRPSISPAWSAAIAYRRLWQGVLIRARRTRVVPLTLITRLAVLLAILLVGVRFGLHGAYLGAGALSCGVVVAAFTALLFARPVIRRLPERGEPAGADGPESALGWRDLLAFYTPLALTTLLNLSSQPVLTAGLARLISRLSQLYPYVPPKVVFPLASNQGFALVGLASLSIRSR